MELPNNVEKVPTQSSSIYKSQLRLCPFLRHQGMFKNETNSGSKCLFLSFCCLQAKRGVNFEVFFFCSSKIEVSDVCALYRRYLQLFSCVFLKLQCRARVVPLRAHRRRAAQRPQHRRRLGRGHVEDELLFNCLDICRHFWLGRRLIFFCQAFFLKIF